MRLIEKALANASAFLAPPVGLEPTTLSVRNIVALLAWGTRNARCFFLLIAPLHLPQAARCSEPVNSGCDANIKQCHSIPCSVEPWFYLYNAINKRFAWCEKSLNNNGVRQLLDGLLAVVLIILQSGVKETRWVAVLRNTGSIPVSANLNLKFYSGHRRRQAFLSCCTVLILLVVSRLFLYLDAQ